MNDHPPAREPTTAASESSAWAIQIATVLGIPIRIHLTFVLLLFWFGFAASSRGENPLRAMIFLLLLFACVALHELGHATMALRFGVRTREIVMYPIGGIARLASIPQGLPELMIALAGPAVNLVLAVLLSGTLIALGLPLAFRPDTMLTSDSILHALLAANLVLLLFNMIPAFPMDGGRVLRAALALRMPADRATQIAATIGQGFAVLGGLAGLFSGNWVLVFIALFVYLGASQEAAFFQQRAAVLGHTAREAMITRFDTLAPQDSLGRAAELLLSTHQQDFPVVDGWQRVAGVLSRGALVQGLARNATGLAVLDVMKRDFPTADPSTDLEEVLRLLQADASTPVLVLDNGTLLGMITLENLAEFIQIAQARPAAAVAMPPS
jgi:stage IV sporulation protein FB